MTKTNYTIHRICAMILLCFLFAVVYGQRKDSPIEKIYFEAAAGATTHKGSVGEPGVKAVVRDSWTAGFSYHSIGMDSRNMPGDFRPEQTLVIFVLIKGETPNVDMKLISLT